MNNTLIKLTFASISAILLMLPITGCAIINPATPVDNNEYIAFIFDEDNVQFSFEYPVNYEIVKVEASGWIVIWLERSSIEKDWIDSDIEVKIYGSGGWLGGTDAKTAFEKEINFISSIEEFRKFKVLNRSSIDIAGFSGVRGMFSYYYPEGSFYMEPEAVPSVKLPTYKYGECAVFDFEGIICQITMTSIEEVAEADTVIFQRILETFKIDIRK